MERARVVLGGVLGLAVLATLASCGGGGIDTLQVPGTPPQVIAVDVAGIDLEGDLLLDGAPFPASQYEHGHILLTDAEGSVALLGDTKLGTYSAPVVAGTYDTVYDHADGGEVVPLNVGAAVAGGLVLAADQTLDVDVASVEVAAAITLNGSPFPASAYEKAEFLLQHVGGGAALSLGFSHVANDPIRVVPGTYDVIYELRDGGTIVPINRHAVIASAVDIQARTSLDIDIQAVASRSTFALDGAAFPSSQYQHGDFFLRNRMTGDFAALGSSYLGAVLHPVIEGTYDVVYRHKNGNAVPANPEAIVKAGVVIDAGSPALSIDVPTATVSPTFTLNGGAFPASPYERADLYLQGAGAADLVPIGQSYEVPPEPILVVKGTYAVHYKHVQGDLIPNNRHVEIVSGISINADLALPIDVASLEITPDFTMDGGSFPHSPYEHGRFDLQGALPADRFNLGLSHTDPETVRVVAGTYDVVYSHVDGTSVPQNHERVVLAGVLLDASQVLPVNVSTRAVQGTFTLNGAPFPASVYEAAEFHLRDKSGGGEILLGVSYLDDNEPVRVVQGGYDVIYSLSAGGDVIPVNEAAVVGSVQVTAP